MYFVGQYKNLQDLSHVKEKNLNPKKIAIENVDINALSLYTLGELRKSSEKKDIIKYITCDK